jgi:hypothetical protein
MRSARFLAPTTSALWLRPMLMTAPLLAGMAACERPDGSLDDQLEAFTIASVAPDGASEVLEPVTLTGVAAATGAGRNRSLVVSTDAGEWALDLHLPGGSDLSVVDGQSVEIDLPPSEQYDLWGRAPFAIHDAAGPVLVVQMLGNAPDAADALLGDGFARYGETVGYDERGSHEFHTKYAVIATDDGPLEVAPGEVHAIQVAGATWRFVLLAAYEVDEESGTFDAASKCIGPPDTLSFEMLRISEPDAGDELVARADGLSPALGQGCGL